MDVSIAVSLIRGQMGTVVERAVNGAVETVLAEMLKVVGVKFDELKTQLALMKRDVAALQREKALKDKENDSIRAKLRYTELKLKYYRQGVEEELQQRVSASTLLQLHPSTNPPQAQMGTAGLSFTKTSASCLSQSRTNDRAISQECTSPQGAGARLHCHSDVVSSDSSDFLFPVSLPENSQVECVDSNTVLFCPTESVVVECLDAVVAPLPAPPSSDGSTQANSSTLAPSNPQVKQEQQKEEEEEVICIKEEPEEEQEVVATLAVNSSGSEGYSSSSTDRSEFQNALPTSFSSAGKNSYLMLQPMTSLPSMVSLHSGVQPGPGARPWVKAPGLHEQYKLRRGELQQRSLNRRRKLEESLPQPLLADMLRERREKTRLRVARWRAKRKLQFCLNQTQAQGGNAGRPQTNFLISGNHQELRESNVPSSGQQRRTPPLPQSSSFHYVSATNTPTTSLPFITSVSSSPSLLPLNSIMTSHHNTVTSSSSSTFPQISHSFPPDVLQ